METGSGARIGGGVGAEALALLSEHAAAVDALIETLPGKWPEAPGRLIESMLYSLRAGGKRLRPALVLEAFRACGGVEGVGKDAALAAALSLEMVHTFSLVHDDLPAMDDDDLRRGMPTNHKVYGEAMAILAGDAMLAGAFEVLADIPSAAMAKAMMKELAWATGSSGMVGGQVLDIDAEGTTVNADALARIHRLKTGALLTASVRMGAIAAGVDGAKLEKVTAFGRHVGLAFQIVDDVLDVTSTPEQLGKATQKDASAGKNTYPAIHGLEASKARAADELRLALTALDVLGAKADGLRSLARFVVEREK
jgi:geranylgeranyl diphosphate synthase type II